MKRIGVFILMALLWSFLSGLTLNHFMNNELETVILNLDTTNTFTWDAKLDSMASNLHDAHQARGSIHVKADATTAIADMIGGNNIRLTIRGLNNYRLTLIAHAANDSVHVGPCALDIPDALSETAGFASMRAYANDLITATTTHYAHTYNTRHRLIAKLFDAAAVAHDAKDTSDVSDVHWSATEVYTTAKVDTTNADSTRASLIRAASRWNTHVKSMVKHKTNSRDTISAALAATTTLYGDQRLANALMSAYNSHAAKNRSTIGIGSNYAIHWAADTNLLTAAAVVHGGHLAADTGGTSKAEAFVEYLMPYYEENIIQFTGSDISSTGATFYIYGSVDSFDWWKADTLNVSANGTTPKVLTTWYPYLKITCPVYVDGTYTVKMKGGK
jgi:hypothetical protein